MSFGGCLPARQALGLALLLAAPPGGGNRITE